MPTVITGTDGINQVQAGAVESGDLASGAIGSGDLPAGSVIQVVQGSTNTGVSTTSSSYVDTGLEASITPLFADSKLLIILTQKLQTNVGGSNFRLARLLENGNTIHEDIRMEGGVSDPSRYTWSLGIISTPSTTSQVTYKTQFRTFNGSGSIEAQHLSAPSYLTLMEIAG